MGFQAQISIKFLSLKIVFNLANSADTEEMPSYAAFNLGLHCFAKVPAYRYYEKG